MSNIIIAQNVSIVNSIVSTNQNGADAAKSKLMRMSDLKKRSVIISEKLKSIGLEKRGILMKACNTAIVLKKCSVCGKIHIESTNLCRDRLCPVCGYLLSVKRYNQMQRTIRHIDVSAYQWRFVTLTIKNCRSEKLSETITAMLKAWDKLCKRVLFKENLEGWARSLEVTFNSDTGTFHPHIHILAAFDSYVPLTIEIAQQWRECLNLNYKPICDIEEPYTNTKNSAICEAIIEAFKYCCKSKQVADMPLLAFKSLVEALKNRRLIAFGGIIKAARAAAQIVEDDKAETVIEDNCCGAALGEIIYRWSFAESQYRAGDLK